MLDVAKLATFRAVVEQGSFSAAAHALHLTQPAVSRQVSALERDLGAMLVRRTKQGAQLTEAGRVLLTHTEAVLARLELAEAEVGELNDLHRGTVRLGAFFSALVHLSAEVAVRLGDAHPGVVVIDDLVDRAAALDKLHGGALDLAIVFEHDIEPAPGVDGIEVHALFDDPLRVVLPAGHRLAEQRAVTIEDLAAETWIRGHDGSAARRVDHLLARAGLHPPLLLAGRGDEPVETQALVAAGKGVALTYDLTVVVSRHELAIRVLAGDSGVRHVQAAVLPGRRPPAVEAALRALLDVGASWRGPAPHSSPPA
jgi:DNA-binding transcriptional LysR family regulator